MAIEEGKKAPAFTLPDENDDKIKLADLTGQWVVLYFYPRDDTPGCTIQACDFTSGIKGFEKLGAVILGCSPDDDESHQKFIKKHKLKIHLLSDPSHRVMETVAPVTDEAREKQNRYDLKHHGPTVWPDARDVDPRSRPPTHEARGQGRGQRARDPRHHDTVADVVERLAIAQKVDRPPAGQDELEKDDEVEVHDAHDQRPGAGVVAMGKAPLGRSNRTAHHERPG